MASSSARSALVSLDFDATHHVDEHILIRHLQPAVTMQHRQQHGETVVVHPHRHPARIGELGVIHQRLQLHQQGRVPSQITMTMEPGACSSPRLRKIAEGLLTSFIPCPVMAKTPVR